MSVHPRSIVCDRVRAQISQRLDEELSQLESRMLASHVARCAECREYEAAVTTLTRALRDAPLESLAHPVVVRRPRRTALVARLQTGAAAALAVAFLGTVTQFASRDSDPSFAPPARFPTASQLTHEVEQIIRDGEAFAGRHGTALPL